MVKRGKLVRGWGAFFGFALACGLMVGSAWAQVPGGPSTDGYIGSLGGPSDGRLVPYFEVSDSLATIIGLENTDLNQAIDVHVTVWSPDSEEGPDFHLCLTEHDFGFVVIQDGPANADQQAELAKRNGAVTKEALVLDVNDFGFPEGTKTGYVTLSAVASNSSTCSATSRDDATLVPSLYVWTILQDVGSGFFATEVPSPAACVAPDGSGGATGKVGDTSSAQAICALPTECTVGGGTIFEFCLLPAGERVGVRYDVNPDVGSSTDIVVWLSDNPGLPDGGSVAGNATRCEGTDEFTWCAATLQGDCRCDAELRGEDEGKISTQVSLPRELNVIDPSTLAGINTLIGDDEFRGVLELLVPAEAGFAFSLVSQEGANFTETFLAYDTGDTDDPATAGQGTTTSSTTTTTSGS